MWAGLLTPQGKCLFDFIVWADGDDLLLDCEAAAADELIKRLKIYRLRRADPDRARRYLWRSTGRRDGVTRPDPRLPQLGSRWLAAADEPASGWLEHRLRLGVCEGRAELGDLLWLECNAAELNGVSFTKGCFVGQENTARMNWRQKVNRRLFVVDGPGGDALAGRISRDRPVRGSRTGRRSPANAIIPDWLKEALAQPSTA